MKGIINWYHISKGFGFIKHGDDEVFFHISEFDKFKKYGVALGQKVEFDIRDGKKGLEAFNIKEIKEDKNGTKN